MALHITSSGDKMTIPSNATTNPRSAITVSFWHYYDRASFLNADTNGMFEMRNDSSGHTFTAYVDSANKVHLRGDTSTTLQSTNDSNTIPLQTWTHWAFTYDGTANTLTIFKNGVQVGQLTSAGSSLDPTVNTTAIGWWNDVAGLTSYYSDFRIYNVARSASQTLSDYNKRLTGSEANLKAYYKLISDVNDSTANANNGTLGGTAAFSSTVGEPPFIASSGGFFLAAY